MKEKVAMPEWLKSLQENSWELEIFISGGAIFTLFKASEYLLLMSSAIKINMLLPGHNVILLVAMFGVKLLTFGFIFHLLLRAFWVAMVFINYVFPEGVNSKKLKWKKPFKVDLDERSDLYTPIMKVDKLSGIVMYLSIISSFAIIGFILMIVMVLVILFSGVIPDSIVNVINYIALYSIIVYLIDLLSFGLIRKIPIVSYIVFPFFKFYDYISLRFLFNRALLVYSTNIHKLRSVIFLLVFVFISIIASYISVQKAFHWPNVFDRREYRHQLADNPALIYYEDEGSNLKVSIPSKIISDSFLDVKVAYWTLDNVLMDNLNKPLEEKWYSDILQIRIDDSIYSNVKWFPYYENSGTYGVEAMIPIYNLPIGEHALTVEAKKELLEVISNDRRFRSSIVVPFWKDENN